MNKIISLILLYFLNLPVSIGQNMEGFWMITEVQIANNEEGPYKSGYGVIEFVNDSVFRFPNNHLKWTGKYKLKNDKVELFISRKFRASGFLRDSLLYLDVDPNYGVYKKRKRKWESTIKSVAKKFKKQELSRIYLANQLKEGIWKINASPNYSYTDSYWQFINDSTAVVDYSHSTELSHYNFFEFGNQAFIELEFGTNCHLVSANEGEIVTECFYMDYMEYEAEVRENIPFSQIVTFKRQEYPSQDEFDQRKNTIIGEWEGIFVYPDMPEQDSDSIFYLNDFWALGDSIIGDTVYLKFYENNVFEAVQRGQYIRNDSLVSEQKTFTGEWELDKSLGYVIINEPEHKHNITYLKLISLDEENGKMSSSGWSRIHYLSNHKMVKKK